MATAFSYSAWSRSSRRVCFARRTAVSWSSRACAPDELGLERRHARLGGVDRGLCVLELGDDGGELRGQHALLRLRVGDLGLKRSDARIDGRLLALGSLAGGSRGHHERDRECEDSDRAAVPFL